MTDDTKLILNEIAGMKEDITELKQDFAEMKEDVAGLKQDFAEMKEDVTELKQDVTGLKRDVREIQLTLENETNRNIQLVAEGHTYLNRRLDDALKIESEKEMLAIRVTSLENEVRRLKEKDSNIAG